mmetsp:Transcript_17992/g.44644  ORF Transcript_17992/g.44644 Transcript_17992/m.44644 type:complete len:318 (-) Transcript_17992:2236-3189(-)
MDVTCLRVDSLMAWWKMARALPGSVSTAMNSSYPPDSSRLFSGARLKSTLKKNLVPTSSTDSKSISPPMHSMMDLVMTNPSPVPFSFATLWSAGWQKGTNSVCCLDAAMPTPLSSTLKVMELRSSFLVVTFMENSTIAVRPSTLELYLMALSTRLTQHWRRRKKSPMKRVLKCSGLAMWITSSTPRLDAFCEMSVTCSMSSRRLKASSLSSMDASLPPLLSLAPSNFAKSSTWLMSPSSASAEVRDALMKLSVNSVSSPLSMASVLNPMMELSGVRSSCVMLKKNARCTCDIWIACCDRCSSNTSMKRREPAEMSNV